MSSDDEDTTSQILLLDLDSTQFMERYKSCRSEFEIISGRHKHMMIVLMKNLEKNSKQGVLNYLNEVYVRLNFNQYYIKEEIINL